MSALLLAVAAAWGQHKAVTLDAVMAGARTPAPVVWSPDGTRFLTTAGTKLMLFDVATQRQNELVNLQTLDADAKLPLPETAFSWENRRAKEGSVQWTADGKQLLVSRSSDLFLLDAATGLRVQLTKSTGRECEAKLAPNGKHVAFRLDHDLQVLDIATRKSKPLTRGGTD